jgi:hypothetical protein
MLMALRQHRSARRGAPTGHAAPCLRGLWLAAGGVIAMLGFSLYGFTSPGTGSPSPGYQAVPIAVAALDLDGFVVLALHKCWPDDRGKPWDGSA